MLVLDLNFLFDLNICFDLGIRHCVSSLLLPVTTSDFKLISSIISGARYDIDDAAGKY